MVWILHPLSNPNLKNMSTMAVHSSSFHNSMDTSIMLYREEKSPDMAGSKTKAVIMDQLLLIPIIQFLLGRIL